MLLDKDVFYTEKFLRIEAYKQRSLYFTQSSFHAYTHTQNPLHRAALHTGLVWHKKPISFAHRSFCAQRFFTQKCTSIYTHPLHTAAFVHRGLYTRKLLHRPSCHDAKGRRRGTKNSHFTTRLDLRHAQSPHRVTFPWPWPGRPCHQPEKGETKASIPSTPIFSPDFFHPQTFPHILFTHRLLARRLFNHVL